MKISIKGSVSATPGKDRLQDLIDEGSGDAVLYELLAMITDDDAIEVWENITGYDFYGEDEEY